MTLSETSLLTAGLSYKNFIVTKHLPLDELQSTLIELTHKPTGASILHIANNDPENLFCLSLQTRPYNSNGVAHILEHIVLCGSSKYPIKDPFFSMTRRSLNTFMNAMTGQDFTCYPASSQVEKDFYNLLDIYLDAVFHPELKKMSFLQEGHRLEFTEPKNPQSPLQIQGVVYNEMKGDMSSSESHLWQALYKHLTPDLTYAHNSGGNPKVIPSLTYEKLLEFHQTYYHPSRCIFFFYGDIPLEKHLNFLEKNVLTGVQKVAPLDSIPLQSRFTNPVSVSVPYPISPSDSPKNKTQVAFSWLTLPLVNQDEILALSLLDNLLMDTDASPLKIALLQSGLCSHVQSSMDTEMSEIPWTIICKGCEPENAEKLKNCIFETLKEIASTPFDPELIEASIHQLEFQRMEIGAEGVPFGLTLFMRAALIKQHGSEAENGLFIHSLFQRLRDHLLDPYYLPNLLQKWIITNPHFVQLTLVPDPEFTEKEKKEEQIALENIRKTLTKADEQTIISQSLELAAYQETVEDQSLECLPKVTLEDVPKGSRDFKLHKYTEKHFTILHHSCFTNKILYADLIFDLPLIEVEDLSLLSLFSRLITELGCNGQNYVKTLERSQAYTGGIHASLSLHPTQENPDICLPTFSLRGKSLARNSRELFQLFADFITSADFTDKDRIKELLAQHLTSLQNRFVKNSIHYAIQTSLSGLSIPSFINDQWSGLPYYQAVKKWSENLDQCIHDLKKLQKQVLGGENPNLVLSCDDDLMNTLKQNGFFNITSIPIHSHPKWQGNYLQPKVPSQARFIASPVAFTALGMRTISHKEKQAPFLLIATELLQNCVLHGEIREKGGAYGSAASYAPSTGNFYFYSYRDPHLSKTVDTFEKSIQKIGSLKFTEQQLEEAKLGIIQILDTPVSPENRAMAAYAWMRSGKTLQMREDFRHNILNATKKDVGEALLKLIAPAKKTLVTFLDKQLFEKDKKNLKEQPIVLPL